ncbi:hypothetical protein CYLTODRAFT_488965 [Cylindrobasidium torrendii FP15055 ss-10]|uniref:F-box domain-containing protein n=1 Tax=Cylindrobasidium torrendii FP15055 ss-10 TaxID=1314674 RepID=A0A0D7BFN7_9AGAR|nr:hypothetical protein CYLTODRAFT_488965 [Cylindrobasidium torrendii FP15055 ss-10]
MVEAQGYNSDSFIDRANFALSRDDLAEISASLAVRKDELETLEETIHILEERMQIAHLRRDELRQSVLAYENLLAPCPIRQLPTEVLAEIFIHYADSLLPEETDLNQDGWQWPRRSQKEQIMLRARNLLLQICRRWKNVAVGAHRYWRLAIIWQPYAHGTAEEREDHWRQIEDCIARAGDTPLFLIFNESCPTGRDSSREDILRGRGILDNCAERASSLVIPHASSRTFDALPPFRLPVTSQRSLRRFVYFAKGGDQGVRAAAASIATSLAAFTNLYSVSIGADRPIETQNLGNTIQQLSIPPVSVESFFSLLHSLPLLRHLQVMAIIRDDTPVTSLGVHQNLRALVVGGKYYWGPLADSLLSRLTLPNLQYFRYFFRQRTWPETDRQDELQFFHRSNGIESLVIDGHTNIGPLFTEVLYSLPALRTVQICSSANTNTSNAISSHFLDTLARKRVPSPISHRILEFTFPEVTDRQLERFGDALRGILARIDEYGLKFIGTDRCGKPEWQHIVRQFNQAGITVGHPRPGPDPAQVML